MKLTSISKKQRQEKTNQVSLTVYKVRIGNTTTCLHTAFVSEDIGFAEFSQFAFNYELIMSTWK